MYKEGAENTHTYYTIYYLTPLMVLHDHCLTQKSGIKVRLNHLDLIFFALQGSSSVSYLLHSICYKYILCELKKQILQNLISVIKVFSITHIQG